METQTQRSMEDIVVSGNLSELTMEQRTQHYLQVCEALGLDHRLHPLEYIHVDKQYGGRDLVLYVLRSGTDQLRKKNGIRITKLTKEITIDCVTFTAEAVDKDGQTDISTGAVSLTGKAGQARADAFMSAETKAKRRVTLSISGVGLLDESEVADMTNTRTVVPSNGGGIVFTPRDFSTPIVSAAPATEVTPAPVTPPLEKDPRINKYKLEVLQDGGMVTEVGLSIGHKWSRYVLMQCPGKHSVKEITPAEWQAILECLDGIFASIGAKGVVLHIEAALGRPK